jgi:polar amino acid transport system permease protein
MGGITLDFSAVLAGQPGQWLLSGLLMTLYVTIAGSLIATVLAVMLLALRIAPSRALNGIAVAIIEVFRNTPILVQFMFWYFAAFGLLPRAVRDFVTADHTWAVLPVKNVVLAPEFLAAAWGLGVFIAAFLAEELRAGLNAVPKGQTEAAISQGFTYGETLRLILLPQALANCWQPLVTQYLNLMKLSSIASAIGLAEITYQVRQVESYNSHAFEAFAVGTAFYLLIGLALGQALGALGPHPPGGRRKAVDPAAQKEARAAEVAGAASDA